MRMQTVQVYPDTPLFLQNPDIAISGGPMPGTPKYRIFAVKYRKKAFHTYFPSFRNLENSHCKEGSNVGAHVLYLP